MSGDRVERITKALTPLYQLVRERDAALADLARKEATIAAVREELAAAKGILDDHRAAVADFRTRIDRIAEAHQKWVDDHGGTDGECTDCGSPWPCPTYRWATAHTVDVNCTWDLSECEFDHDHDAPRALDGTTEAAP